MIKIKPKDYRSEWGQSLTLLKEDSGFYDPNVARLYKEGQLVRRFNLKLNQDRLYEVK